MRNRLFTMHHSAALFTGSILFAVVGCAVIIHAQSRGTAEPHTAAAVIADDEGWSKAETAGDTNYVNALLLPEYRSISSNGSTHDKAAILAHAAKNAGSKEDANKVDAWRTAHPYNTSVTMNGDIAILTFVLDKEATPKPVMSCDVFVYRDGHWRALYSQHTEAGK